VGHSAATDPSPVGTMRSLALGERALHVDGNPPRARAALSKAFAQAELESDAQSMARAALGLAGLRIHEIRAVAEAAALEARQRLALAQLEPASTLALRLRTRLEAEADYRVDRSSGVAQLLEEARARGAPVALAEALSLTYQCVLGPQNAAVRCALAEELIRVAASTGRPSDTVMGLLWRAVDLFLAGDRQAERAYADLTGHRPASHSAAASFVTSAMRVMLTIRAGHLVEAETLAEECARAGAAVGDADWLSWYAAHLITVRWFQGRIGELVDTVSNIVNSPALSVVDNSFVAAQAVACAAAGETRQARGALARIRGPDLADLPTSSTWLTTMATVIEATALLDERPTAARAYQLMLPYADLPVMASIGVACLGSAQHSLGIACLVTGDLHKAVGHLEASIAHNSAIGHWPATTLSRHRLAQTLSVRGASGDARTAAGLAAEAATEAAELGMRLPEPVARMRRTMSNALVCSRRGKSWRVELWGRAAVVDDMVGLHYLATLVANPGIDIPAVELAGPERGPGQFDSYRQPVLDEKALSQYRARLRTLAAQIDEAEASGDVDRLTPLRSESDWIAHEVRMGTGLSGRPRQFPDGSERARIAVGKAIRRALERVSDEDSVIGRELRARVETGRCCCYRPAESR